MHYNLAQLFREPIGSTRDYEVDDSFVGPEDGLDRAQGWVRVIRTHEGFLICAELETQVSLTCSRCLSPFELHSELTMEEESFPSINPTTGRMQDLPGETDGAILLDDQQVLDMGEVLRQYVITEVPIKPLCCEKCLGLCPECGSNQNKKKCKCNAAPADPRWGALAELLTEKQD